MSRGGFTGAPEKFSDADVSELREWMEGKPALAEFADELDDILEVFLDYWRARDGHFKDWLAAARNWIRKECSMRDSRLPPGGANGPFGRRRDVTARTEKSVAGAVTLLKARR